jgi:acyl carrier protein
MIEREVAGLLRDQILLGSDRQVDFDAPLGPGVGLDSLGLMEFLATLEERFGVDFPDGLWTERRQFTLGRLVDYLGATRPDATAGLIPDEPPSPATREGE